MPSLKSDDPAVDDNAQRGRTENGFMTVRAPIDVRSVALAVLAVFGTVLMLDWAAAVFIPVLLGLMSSYALSPIVDRMHAMHIPRAIGAAVLLLGILGGIGATIYSIEDDASQVVESLPDTAQKLRHVLRPHESIPATAIENVQRAASQLEQAAVADTSTPARGVTRVQIEQPPFDVKSHLWTGTLGFIAFLGQATVVCFITFFLLAAGDTFRRKLVRIAGPTLTKQKITLQVLNEITGQIKRYLLVQLFASLIVGVASFLAFLWLGLQHAAVWGVAAGVLNLVPYIGGIAITGTVALVGFMQTGTLDLAWQVAAASIVIHGIVGYVLGPWLTGRAGSMHPIVVFIAVLAWGWLWGIWGLLLGVPIMMAIKAICDHIEGLKPIGELLGD
jgi:predicted PurR-regulated permease PerM